MTEEIDTTDAELAELFNEMADEVDGVEHETPEPEETVFSEAEEEELDDVTASMADDAHDETIAEGSQSSDSPNVDDLYAQLQKDHEQLTHRFKSDEGRQAALQRKIQELEQRPQAESPKPDNVTDDQWAAMKEDYPEIANAFDSRLNAATSAMRGEMKQQLQPYEQQAQQNYANSQKAALEAAHTDWEVVAKAPEFTNWLGKQPQIVRDLTRSDNAADAAYVLDTFKSMTGYGQPDSEPSKTDELREKRSRQLATGATQPRRGTTSRDLSADSESAMFDKFAKQLDAQRR